MSKTAEQKALEAYPEDYAWCKCDDEEVNYTEIDDEGTKWLKVDCNEEFRTVYTKGYDSAMQEFLEKACKYLAPINYTHPHLIDLDEFKQIIETYINTEEVKSDIDFGYYWGMYVEGGGNINNYEVAKYFFELGNKLKEGQNEMQKL